MPVSEIALRVFDTIRAAADAGEVSPMDSEICNIIGRGRSVLRTAMTALVDEGLIVIESGAGFRVFTIVASGAKTRLRGVDPVTGLNVKSAAVLSHIEEVAAAGEAMPSNPSVAKALGLTLDNVEWAMRNLSKAGVIRSVGSGGSRRITIVSTGAATDWSAEPALSPNPRRFKGSSVKKDQINERQGELMAIIKGCAASGAAMPGNHEIAEQIVCSDETVSRDLRALARRGVLVVEKVGAGREITVVETGEKISSASEVRTRRVVRVVHSRPAADPEPGCSDDLVVADEVQALTSILPCARVACMDVVARGGAYCAAHEADVLEWPRVDLEIEEEDLAA